MMSLTSNASLVSSKEPRLLRILEMLQVSGPTSKVPQDTHKAKKI